MNLIPLKVEPLHKFLLYKNFNAVIQPETGQIYVIFKYHDRDFPLFFRLYDDSDLLQLLAFIPCGIQQKALSDLARLLHHVNRELDIPGFGMDETAGLVFYRIMLPCSNKEIDPQVLSSLIETVQNVSESFSPLIATVAGGLASLEQVLAKIKEEEQKI